MTNRKTRKGGGVFSIMKYPFYGEKDPNYAIPVSETREYDKDVYEVAGNVSMQLSGAFAFFRTQEYVEKYFKHQLAEMAKKQFPSADRLISFTLSHKQDKIGEYLFENIVSKGTKVTTIQPIYGPLQYIAKATILRSKGKHATNNQSNSKSRSRTIKLKPVKLSIK